MNFRQLDAIILLTGFDLDLTELVSVFSSSVNDSTFVTSSSVKKTFDFVDSIDLLEMELTVSGLCVSFVFQQRMLI